MKKKNVLLVIGLIVYVGIMIGVISYTYSYYTASATNTGVISGTAASYDLEVTVTKVENSGTGDLVPQLDSTITKAIQGTNGTLCLDGNGNTVCQVYEISVENLSNANLVVYGYLDLNAGNNPNLKWAEVDGVSNPSLLSSVNSYTTTLLANGDDLEVNSINTYYVVIWISETGSSQSDTGDFTGVVTFSTEQMDYAKQTLVKLGLENSVNSKIPYFDHTSQQADDSEIKCRYLGNEVISFEGEEVTEETCEKVYLGIGRETLPPPSSTIASDLDVQIIYRYFDSSIEKYYVGTGTWDNINSVCKYNDAYVVDIADYDIEDESLCGDIYEYEGTYYSGIEEVGSGTFESLTGATGIYAAQDDLGTSYYFRGAVDNNWVYFAGIYWRIIRINGDGSIRMIYSGTTAPTSDQAVVMTGNGTQVGESAFNSSYNDNKYVGYTYDNDGTETDSTIKNYIENTWYANTLLNTEYEQYIVDAIYCNDREVSKNSTVYDGWNDHLGAIDFDVTSTTLGQGNTKTLYKSEERLGSYATPRSPSLKCNQDSDKYTVSTSLGNGKLKYKVGLITADEIVMAGGITDTSNTSFYLYTSSYYWSLTPRLFGGYGACVWSYFSDLYSNNVNYSWLGVGPVVSLSSNVTILGNGTYLSPFTIS